MLGQCSRCRQCSQFRITRGADADQKEWGEPALGAPRSPRPQLGDAVPNAGGCAVVSAAARKIVRIERPAPTATALPGGGGGGTIEHAPASKLGPYLCKLYRRWQEQAEEGSCKASE